MSCTAGKIHLQNPCAVKQVSGGYNKINDSDFSLVIPELGRSYLNFIVDSCKRINNAEINLTGYITFAGDILIGNDRKMPGVDIIQVSQTDKRMLRYMQHLGKTDLTGRFDIRINILNKDVVILLDKQNFNYTSISLSF
jgi:hypothetical protein